MVAPLAAPPSLNSGLAVRSPTVVVATAAGRVVAARISNHVQVLNQIQVYGTMDVSVIPQMIKLCAK